MILDFIRSDGRSGHYRNASHRFRNYIDKFAFEPYFDDNQFYEFNYDNIISNTSIIREICQNLNYYDDSNVNYVTLRHYQDSWCCFTWADRVASTHSYNTVCNDDSPCHYVEHNDDVEFYGYVSSNDENYDMDFNGYVCIDYPFINATFDYGFYSSLENNYDLIHNVTDIRCPCYEDENYHIYEPLGVNCCFSHGFSNPVLGFYNTSISKSFDFVAYDDGFNMSNVDDNDYFIVMNVYEYSDNGNFRGHTVGDGVENWYTLADDNGISFQANLYHSFKQIIGAFKVFNHEIYFLESGYIGADDWLEHSIKLNNNTIDFCSWYFYGRNDVRSHNINLFGNSLNFEIVEVGNIMSCTDECILGLIDAIDNFRTVFSDVNGEINVSLSDIAQAIRNYQFVITFPQSYNVNVKEMPCIDFCNGASVGVEGSLGISSVPQIIPIGVTQFPTDWLGGLIAGIATIAAALLQKDLSVTNNITVPPSSVTVNPSTATIQNVVNVPDTIDIGSLPCIDFCSGASLGIDNIPNVRISSIPTIGIDELPDDFWDELLEKMDDLFVTCENQTLGDILANAFLYSCSDSVFKPLTHVDGRSFWDLLHDCFYSCDTVSLATMFSEAFNLSNCLGSVFKANDNWWNDEDTIAGIWFKQLDKDYVDIHRKSVFYCDYFYGSGLYAHWNVPDILLNSFYKTGRLAGDLNANFSNFSFNNYISITDVLKRALFIGTDNNVMSSSQSVFNMSFTSVDNNKILNHACSVNPNSIKFCEDVPLTLPTPVVNVTNEVIPASVSVNNNVPTPSVTVNNTVPVPDVTIENNPENVINVSPAENIPPNVFVNADGKSFLTEVPFR